MRGSLAAGLLAVFLIAGAPARAAVPAGNLVVDPGAEASPGAPDSSASAPPAGWTVTGPFAVVQYGAPAFLTAEDSTALGGGTNFFAGGPDGAENTASQAVSVAGAAAEIDAGGVAVTLSGQLGGYASQTDAMTVTATFVNAAGASLGALTIGPVTPADRNSTTELLARAASGTVPAGTRTVVVTLDAMRYEGQYNDGYADNISLTLGGPPVFHKTVAVKPSGTVLVKLPGSSSFVPLAGPQSIPLGATIDTRKGRVTLSSVPKAGGKVQSADFYDGIFKVTQQGAITDLQLTEELSCAKGGKASAAAKKPKTRKLWGDGSGSFRTRGHYSAATVRGTQWLVQDTCTSTLTRVKRGVVSVRDNVKHKTITLRAGKSYTARKR